MDDDLAVGCTKAKAAPSPESNEHNASEADTETVSSRGHEATPIQESLFGPGFREEEEEEGGQPSAWQPGSALELLHRRLFDPALMIFVSILNQYMPKTSKGQQQVQAEAIGVVSAAMSHWRAGRRFPAIGMIHAIASGLKLPLEAESLLVTAWFFDREILALREMFESISVTGNLDSLALIRERLDLLQQIYIEKRFSSRNVK